VVVAQEIVALLQVLLQLVAKEIVVVMVVVVQKQEQVVAVKGHKEQITVLQLLVHLVVLAQHY
jgi:hypothetical protein